MTLATIAIALATIVYVYVTYKLLKITKITSQITHNYLKATNRPYIGVDVDCIYDRIHLHINPTIKNYGNITARNVNLNWSAFLENDKLPVTDISSNSIVLPPQANVVLHAGFEIDLESIGITPSLSMRVEFNITYDGVNNEKYHYNEIYNYDNNSQRFIRTNGDCN